MTNLFLLAALTLAPAAQPASPTPGIYDSLQLAVDPASGVITGSFFDQTGLGKFTCAFFLYSVGKPSADGVYRVVTWSPNPTADQEVVSGSLRFEAAAAVLKLPKQAHGGCWNVNPDLDQGQDTTLGFTTDKPWREGRVVQGQKVWFHASPDRSSRSAAYLVDGDYVDVIGRRGDWLQVDYVGRSGQIRSGWMPQAGLQALRPPMVPAEKR